MAWQDVANQRLGPQAPGVISQLNAANPNFDWSDAINKMADWNTQQYGMSWQDPNRGSGPMIAAQIVQTGGDAAQSATPWQTLAQQGTQRDAEILKQQNPPDKGMFGGGGIFPLLAMAAAAYFTGGASLAAEGAGAAGAGALGGMAGDAVGMGIEGAMGMGGATAGAWGGADALAGAAGAASMAGDLPWGANPAQTFSLTPEGASPGMINATDWSAVTGPGSVYGAGGTGANWLGSLLGNISPMTALSGANLISSLIGSNAAKTAAGQQAGAANQATASQLGMFNTINEQNAPFRQAGYNAIPGLLAGIGMGPSAGGVNTGQFTHQFNAGDLNANMAPNYQFSLEQGLGQVRNAANATGGLVSGNTLKALQDYTYSKSQDAYQNAFTNYNTNQNNIVNRLLGVAGLGTGANTTTANAGTAISGNAAQTQVGAGTAQAAGTVGAANAFSGGLNNAASWYALPSLLNFGGGNNSAINYTG